VLSFGHGRKLRTNKTTGREFLCNELSMDT
jgi:hypothetical protein